MSKEPCFTVREAHGAIELRDYESFVVAEVEVKGERKEAITKGFRLLADFIFGNNQEKTKIAMSTPVSQQKVGESWKVRFVMPGKYSLQTIPKPNNPQIALLSFPPSHLAVIRFSGTPTDKKIELKSRELEAFCKQHGWSIADSPIYAFYNPPWTLPFLRRNEVMYMLQNSQ